MEYCEGNDIKYTRYADDLFFSSNNKEVLLKLKEDIETLILKHRTEFFDIKINGQKTKFITEPWHKKVTGITINNNKIKTSKTLKRDIRRELYFTIIKNKTDYNKLIGQIAFVISIEKDYAEKIKSMHFLYVRKIIYMNTKFYKYLIKWLNHKFKIFVSATTNNYLEYYFTIYNV